MSKSKFTSSMDVVFTNQVCHSKLKDWREWADHFYYATAYKEFVRLTKIYGADNVQLLKKTKLRITRTEVLG